MISKVLFNFSNFCVISVFLTKLLTLGILFSTADNGVFVAKLPTSRILSSNSVTCVFLAKSVGSEIFFSNSVLSGSYLFF